MKIAVIPGDGVGQEVVPAGVSVLAAVNGTLEFTEFDWGSAFHERTGRMMPEDGSISCGVRRDLPGLDRLADGARPHLAVGWPHADVRKTFELYANLRPVKLLPGIRGPLADRGPEDIDMVFVRENTEGEYAGTGGLVHDGHDYGLAVEVPVFTRQGIARVARYAFGIARERSGI